MTQFFLCQNASVMLALVGINGLPSDLYGVLATGQYRILQEMLQAGLNFGTSDCVKGIPRH